jgi:hypothetical protein
MIESSIGMGIDVDLRGMVGALIDHPMAGFRTPGAAAKKREYENERETFGSRTNRRYCACR